MHGTKVKCDFNKAINMHSSGPTEQHFYIWEPRCGYLHKVKKNVLVPLIEEGHRLAIILENVLVPPCSILLNNFMSIFGVWGRPFASRERFTHTQCKKVDIMSILR